MGLITPIELPTVDELGAVHFIAIGGSGMNGIASMMLAQRSWSCGMRGAEWSLGRVPGMSTEPYAGIGSRPGVGTALTA